MLAHYLARSGGIAQNLRFKRREYHLQRVVILLFLLCLAGCGKAVDVDYTPRYVPQRPDAPAQKQYIFGILPQHNPRRLFRLYAPIIDLLNSRLTGVSFTMEASRSYEEYDKKLYGRHFDLALANPYQTVNALKHGYQVFGKMADDQQFRGILLVRKDGRIHDVGDLRGQAISFPARTALAATMMPQQFLHDKGLPFHAYESRYVGSQESSIMNVYLGNTAAGATWIPPWTAFQKDHPEEAAQLVLKWQTGALPNNGLVARDDFPPEILEQVSRALFSLQDSQQGREILARLPVSAFESARPANYEPVRAFLVHFARTVRPLEET